MSDEQKTFTEHLSELRKRLILAMAAIVAASLGVFGMAGRIAEFVMRPASGLDFVYLSPPELFMSYVKLSLIAGTAAASPIVLYQVWAFVKPALSKRERRSIAASLLFGELFFAGGGAFAFLVIVPFTIKFFLSYASTSVQPLFSIKEYFDFVSSLVLSFGAAFELPMACAALGALGVLSAKTLAKSRRLAILGIFIAAAILTPPDVVSQILLALPMLGLYELSHLILRVIDARRSRRAKVAEAALA
ncbi:MAG: twin-arginine translocase subunit TatC [Spirochaetaceae bacterium]|nr:twin-arginine translocase subunit TatC [Spirochaetaceae bacterium]